MCPLALPLTCTHVVGRVCTLGAVSVYALPMEVGIKELRSQLSDYLARVREGNEVVITDRGAAVARIIPITGGRAFDRAVAEGLVTPAIRRDRTRPDQRVQSRGSITDLVAEQRR
jgi:prevent-host-death family protein